MKQCWSGRSVLLSVAVICALALAGLWAFRSPVQAADPCTTPGVVCVPGDITSDQSWTSDNIYYVTNDILVSSNATLTIEGGTIVKFDYPYSATSPNSDPYALTIDKGAHLVFQDTNDTDRRILFTSGRDDSPEAGGDTNGDANQTLPGYGDWKGLVLIDWASSDPIENLTFRYSRDGLNIQSKSQMVPDTVVVQNNAFYQSLCGMTVSALSNYDNQLVVLNNGFYENQYGLCTSVTGSGTGKVVPAVRGNHFEGSVVLPILLSGASYPAYDTNTYVGTADSSDPDNQTDHLGIGVSGKWNSSGTWNVDNDMPFVVVTTLEITTNASITVNEGTVVKLFTQTDAPIFTTTLAITKINVYGTLDLLSTPEHPIVFTSYRDDSIAGDTNGDGDITIPQPGDWDSVYYKDTLSSSADNLTIQYLDVRYGTNGILYEITNTSAVRQPTFRSIVFTSNRNGLRLKAVSNNTVSRLEPTIDSCTFLDNGVIPDKNTATEPGVPILLENVVQPVYINNTFTGNLHPAIGVKGTWRSDATWEKVAGDGLDPMPYLVHSNVQFGNMSNNLHDDSATLTIPESSVVKFNVNPFDRNNYTSRLTVAGILALESSAGHEIVFTSYYDSVYGGTTSVEGITPAPQDWGDLIIRNPQSEIHDVILRYGDKGLHFQSYESSTANSLEQGIVHSRFEYNEYGVYLNIQSNANIAPLIQDDIFSNNSYGLGTTAKNPSTGMSLPVIRSSAFEQSTEFPIYLNGSATLKYLEASTTFQQNAHRAIALGGYFGGIQEQMLFPHIAGDVNAPLNGQTFPYVVLANVKFDWNTSAKVDGGLVFKFADGTELKYYGVLEHNTTSGSPNYYTSYRDDYYDDTNGTPSSNPSPSRGNWKGVYIYNPGTVSFSYSTIKWADQGLVIFQDPASTSDLAPLVNGNTFTENKNGLTCQIESGLDILSSVTDNTFSANDFGLHTYSNPSKSHYGTCNLTLTNNTFQGHAQFPIYLQGSANPTYSNNTFSSNTHPAIAVGGVWARNATWTHVYDATFGQIMPYVVWADLTQEYSVAEPSITIPGDTIVKLADGKYIYAWSYLDLPEDSVKSGHEVVFTSYRDDTYGGDINADGATTPSRTAWKTVWLIDFPGKVNDIHNVIVRYATAGLGIYYDGPENTQSTTTIRDSFMQYNTSCIALTIAYWKESNGTVHPGVGNIQATLENIRMTDSDYGLLTIALDKSTGIVQPTLKNIQFTNIAKYPIFLGGTSYPSFLEGNTIQATPGFSSSSAQSDAELPVTEAEAEEIALGGMELPGNLEALASISAVPQPMAASSNPGVALASVPDIAPAIGLAGAWNNSGTLANISGIPYAITGSFPLTVTVHGLNYKPADDVTIGATNPAASTATVTVPEGVVFKFGSSRKMTVKGALSLLSTPSQPVIFTSIKDDAAFGDTNGDGAKTVPAKNDWGELQLAYGSTDFHHAIVRYATNGLHLYFDGAGTTNLLATVRESSFMHSKYGILLTAKKMGNVVADINHNTFKSNDTHIYGEPSDAGNSGQLCIAATQNDLWGNNTQNGITNMNLNGVTQSEYCELSFFDARNNFWGSSTGPTHSGNPGGMGTIVSDRVTYQPWLGAAVLPTVTYSISGRVTQDTAQGSGLSGVQMVIQGEDSATAVTDQDGYYQFEGLQPGSYFVYPSKAGYLFTPPSVNLTIEGADATEINFVGSISPTQVAFLLSSASALRPLTATPTVNCTFTVALDKPLADGQTAKVDYATIDGTAVKGVDYTAKSGTLTFQAGKSTTQQVLVKLLVGTVDDPTEFFYLYLSNPINATLTNSAATCTILNRNDLEFIFIPLVRK